MTLLARSLKFAAIGVICAGIVGCETKAGSGALIGGGTGAVVGGLIGSNSHGRAGEGALIGGAVGAIGGALVGNGMDKKDEHKHDSASSSSPHYRERDSSTTATTYNASHITSGNVIDWTRQGVREDIIIDRIQRSGQTFAVTSTDERQMRDAGVSPSVIAVMKTNH